MSTGVLRTRSATGHRQAEQPALPAWPVLAVLWGYPLFWASGMLMFSMPIMAVVMLAFLMLRRPVRLVPGILGLVAFALWMLPSAIMVDTIGQLLSLLIRFSNYGSVAVMMIYIVNARRSLTPRRLLNGLTFVWVFLILAGYLGILVPYGRLTLTIGQLLPAALLENDYVYELTYPGFAEIQTPWGADEPFVRPSAPFAYSNGWGSAFAILTPIAVANAVSYGSARAYIWLAVAGVAAIAPATATTNRGLFVGLGLCLGYVLLRAVLARWWRTALGLGVVGIAGTGAVMASGLLTRIADRQLVVDTTDGRLDVYLETFLRTLSSPILGYGAPRPGQTTEIYVGTQGAVWMAMFCFGFVGLALFLAFLVTIVIRTAPTPNIAALWAHSSLVVALVLSTFYGMDRQVVFLGVVAAMILAERYRGGSTWWRADLVPFARRADGV
ncbi:MAG: O-antigen ligase domain-containing protein [Beutenbergiaceae bacterium]